MARPSTLLLALLFTGCFGQPEDVFRISGTIRLAENLSEQAELTIWRDEGHTEAGCSTFSKWKTLNPREQPYFSVPLLRAEAETATQQPRCFRAELTDGPNFMEAVWIFSDQDVTLPPLRWGVTPLVTIDGPRVWLSRLLVTDLPEDLGPPSYVAELLSPSMRWREASTSTFLDLPSMKWEGVGPGEVKGYAKFAGSKEAYDPFGQLKQHRYELRLGQRFPIATNPLPITPPSRGRPCDLPGDAPCPLTDGKTVVGPLPEGTLSAVVGFPPGTVLSHVYLRGLWAGDALQSVIVESADTVGDYQRFGALVAVPLLRQHRKLDERPSIDVDVIGNFGIPTARLRIRAIDGEGRTLPLLSLGEVSAL